MGTVLLWLCLGSIINFIVFIAESVMFKALWSDSILWMAVVSFALTAIVGIPLGAFETRKGA